MYRGIWTWEKCGEKLQSLRGRLGFPDSPNLRFLELNLSLETGQIQDEIKNAPFSDIQAAIYCILSGYADAKIAEETCRLVSFSQIPGGENYNNAFGRRALQPIEKAFGTEPERFLKAAAFFDGEKMSLGDCSAKIYALPLVPIVIILHVASSEFSASANMLFDSSVSNFLSTEQTAMLSELTSARLRLADEAIT